GGGPATQPRAVRSAHAASHPRGRGGHLPARPVSGRRDVCAPPVFGLVNEEHSAALPSDPTPDIQSFARRLPRQVRTGLAMFYVRRLREGHELPASAWTALGVRQGAAGPLVFEFAAIRVWGIRHRKPGPPSWLLIRRSLGPEPELKFYISNADAETPLSTL